MQSSKKKNALNQLAVELVVRGQEPKNSMRTSQKYLALCLLSSAKTHCWIFHMLGKGQKPGVYEVMWYPGTDSNLKMSWLGALALCDITNVLPNVNI